MIKLKSDVITIEVEPSNPIYKALSRFDGEVFVVQSENKKEEAPKKPSKPPERTAVLPEVTPVQVNIKEYYDGLNRLYPTSAIDDNEKNIVKNILLNHAYMFFGSKENLGVYTAVAEEVNKELVTCVRVIDNSLSFITVPRELVNTQWES